jgi:hypothetical protein
VPIHYAWMEETEVGWRLKERLKMNVDDGCELSG